LIKSSEKYADKAEATVNLVHLTKSNSLRKTEEKKAALPATVDKLEEKNLDSHELNISVYLQGARDHWADQYPAVHRGCLLPWCEAGNRI
jgi:hypothetical protein